MTVYQIPLAKAKGHTIAVDTKTDIPDHIYEYALQLGLKAILNRGTSKLKQEDYANADAYAKAAVEIAEKQLEAMKAGKTRIVGAKAGKAASKSPEHTMALEFAKKDAISQLRAAGIKVSLVSSADKTAAGKMLFDADPERYLAAAREALAKMATPVKGVDLAGLIHEDPELKKKAAKKSADAKKATEDKKAGKAPPKAAKAKPEARANH